MYVSKLKLWIVGILTAITFTGLGTGVAAADQWRMFDARDDLQNAKNALQAAEPDKGGHRVNAINLVQQAIDQVNWGIQAGR
ncbi:hypothetical protein FZI85_19245 [Mycobacterium sp. CBMA293]|uniref:hypothetical protein n=1 Tax=unclassified Mycolicibacterium TaxID=2636767 RepID=UPI0012DD56D8|nr:MULTISPECIES: hypothetical protein [unclassified Mycolicibacterium]MUL48683.1 hypothetical protein [Mycolicibacterium sp. CBMA 360]MUL60819.1 hypothetical protein [Mycolicibacterium sp. CBMA 335]MUL71832.1 hypothetical protein [Mycolicibacterium sp. CBMA 311]MUL95760.1 hypothetical protein [Mycolicibacterium sp. CBMA 230]MUM03498.1 hypothetical protein [Mycolicibacterium sp. CBMA 213]